VMMTRLQAQMTDKVWSETGCAAGWMEMVRVEGSKRLPPHAQQHEMAGRRRAPAPTVASGEEQGKAHNQHTRGRCINLADSQMRNRRSRG
jgi:hypothetical protein